MSGFIQKPESEYKDIPEEVKVEYRVRPNQIPTTKAGINIMHTQDRYKRII